MFSVAINGGKNQDGSDRTTFVNIKAFGKQGEIIAQSFKKGHRIKADVNQIEASAWLNQQSGQAQSSLNAILTGFDFVETRAETGQAQAQPGVYNAPPQAGTPPQAQQTGHTQPPARYAQPQGGYAQPPGGYPPPPAAAPVQQPQYSQPQGAPQQNYASSPWG